MRRFIHTLTHDLRTPLTAAHANAQLIRRRPDQAEHVAVMAAKAIESLDRVNRMIEDLLDSARIRAGKRLSVELIERDLVALAKQIQEDLAVVHGDRIRLKCTVSSIVGFWDVRALRRAIENLIDNSFKYGTTGAPVILSVDQPSSHWAEISVHNEGNPISEEEQKGLFRAFERGSHSGGRIGWGIGLTRKEEPKAKVVKRMGYGYKQFRNYRLKVLTACC